MTKAVNNKKSKNKTNENNKTNKPEWTLIATFVFLVLLVIVLVIVALNMKNITSTKTNDITIPILEENSKNEVSVDISDMDSNAEKVYIFTITNYKGYDTNEKEIDYSIKITPPETVKIKLYKNNKEYNFEDNMTITDNKLPANTQTEDEYKLIMESTKKLNKHSKITIEINS